MSQIDVQKIGQSSIGCGTVGTVYPYSDETGDNNYVVKHFWARNEKELVKCERELKIGSTLDHPNILTIKDYLKNEDSREGWMVYQKIERMQQDLSNFINKRSETQEFVSKREVLKCFYYMIDAVDYLSKHHIVNQSIKPSNIFIDNNGNVKISDFGMSRIIKEEDQIGIIYYKVGTRFYSAPEMVTTNIVILEKDFSKVDVWGIGLCIVELCLLQTKILMSDGHQRLHDDRILKQALSNIGKRYGEDLKDLLKGLLDIEPWSRKTIAEVKREFENRFCDEVKRFIEERGKKGVFTQSEDLPSKGSHQEEVKENKSERNQPASSFNSIGEAYFSPDDLYRLDVENILRKWTNFRFEKAEDPNFLRVSGYKLSEVEAVLDDISNEERLKDVYELAISLAGLGSVQDTELRKIAAVINKKFSNVKFLNVSFEGTEILGCAVLEFLTSICQNLKQLKILRALFKGCRDDTDDFKHNVKGIISGIPEYEFVTNDTIFERRLT